MAAAGNGPSKADGDVKAYTEEEVKDLLAREKMEVHDMVEPGKTTFMDCFYVFLVHMLPFTLFTPLLFTWMIAAFYKSAGLKASAVTVAALGVLSITPPIYSKAVRKFFWPSMIAIAKYLKRVRYVVPVADAPDDRPYIFCFHPHGRMFFSSSLLIQTHGVWGKGFNPRGDLFGGTAGGIFSIPIVRQLAYLTGNIAASKEELTYHLKRKHNVTITIGGVKEILLGTYPDHDPIYLLNRKGFLKLAMQYNAGVVPIYMFNENELFQYEPAWVLAFWRWINRYVTVGVPMFRGMWNLPMPKRKEVLYVIGHPLFAKEGESVDDFHTRYVAEIRRIFDAFVRMSPKPNHKLVIK